MCWVGAATILLFLCLSIPGVVTGFRHLAYTSVLTRMNIMTRKGYLKRKKEGRTLIYAAVIRQEETTRGILGGLVERAFEGSAKVAVANLLDTVDIDGEEPNRFRDSSIGRSRRDRDERPGDALFTSLLEAGAGSLVLPVAGCSPGTIRDFGSFCGWGVEGA